MKIVQLSIVITNSDPFKLVSTQKISHFAQLPKQKKQRSHTWNLAVSTLSDYKPCLQEAEGEYPLNECMQKQRSE